jgi:hypothetical protein
MGCAGVARGLHNECENSRHFVHQGQCCSLPVWYCCDHQGFDVTNSAARKGRRFCLAHAHDERLIVRVALEFRTISPVPKTFISYSWSSPAHERWVIDLATQLVENGVEVVLDKWDLREGNDAVQFMESMVTDPEVAKVIIVSDQKYAEKANNRKGGVGTESQIMSPEIYKKADQSKFAAVVSEVDANGEPYLPAFLSSRIYIDMTETRYATNFEQLLRWVFEKPAYVKPALGKMPAFLNDEGASPTRANARRTIEAFNTSSRAASSNINSMNSFLYGKNASMLSITACGKSD